MIAAVAHALLMYNLWAGRFNNRAREPAIGGESGSTTSQKKHKQANGTHKGAQRDKRR
ncbi:MAG TPA: hypothetical protein VHM64_05500 [Candidatus Binatia bacterium]|nr:hypothetical protein [Candidatus Binatia bacterium]